MGQQLVPHRLMTPLLGSVFLICNSTICLFLFPRHHMCSKSLLSKAIFALQFAELLQSPEKQAEEFESRQDEFAVSVRYLQAILGC